MTTATVKLVLRPHGRNADGSLVVMVVGIAHVKGPLADVMEWKGGAEPYNDYVLAFSALDTGEGAPSVPEIGIAALGRQLVGMGANDILTDGFARIRASERIR